MKLANSLLIFCLLIAQYSYGNLIDELLKRLDSDSDGLNDYLELRVNLTNHQDPDSDDDGLSDGDEVNIFQTDPLADADLDGDGLTDAEEILVLNSDHKDPSDPNSPPTFISLSQYTVVENENHVGEVIATDPDGDNILYDLLGDSNILLSINEITGELSFVMAPDFESNPSTYQIYATATDSLGFSSTNTILITLLDDRNEDADNDGLTELQEEDLHQTSDLDDDSDDDGLKDGYEVNVSKTNPKAADTDNDGMNDQVEIMLGSFVLDFSPHQNSDASMDIIREKFSVLPQILENIDFMVKHPTGDSMQVAFQVIEKENLMGNSHSTNIYNRTLQINENAYDVIRLKRK